MSKSNRFDGTHHIDPSEGGPPRRRPPGRVHSRVRLMAATLAVGVGAAGLAGCGAGSAADPGTYLFWDPYPQYTGSSAWAKLVKQCGREAGVNVQRTAYDTTDLTNKAILAAQQAKSPDVLLVDNPVVSTLASAGVLTSNDENGLATGKVARNILDAGRVDGKTYGTPIGANTLALYYNPKILKAAGVDASSVKDWASLTRALAKVKGAGYKGITFAGINTEEGSFQFLPWFWGAGGKLTQLDSPAGVAALQLWGDWLKKGYAPNSVIQNSQTTSWQEFATGKVGFAENGTWQKAEAEKMGAKVMTIPGRHGGDAPGPTGGEFFTVPVQKDSKRYAVSTKIIDCLSSTSNVIKTDNTLNYLGPTKTAQQRQLAADPSLKPWVRAVGVAKARTGRGLGTDYPVISQEMWTAVQKAESGAASASAAMQAAQQAATEKAKK